MYYKTPQTASSKILDLVDSGDIDADGAMRSMLQWMSEADIQEMVDTQPDWEGFGIQTDEEE